MKRDRSRPPEEKVSTTDHESASTSSSSPLEIVDIDTTGSIRSIFDRVRNTLSPAVRRRTSENCNPDESCSPSISETKSNEKSEKVVLRNQKSVSFAGDVENSSDSDNGYSTTDQNQIANNAQRLADQILTESIGQAAARIPESNISEHSKSIDEFNENDFREDFRRCFQQRRILDNTKEDLIYQDLSAEIVSYILKHALRTLKKEHEELHPMKNQQDYNQSIDDEDDPIDLK